MKSTFEIFTDKAGEYRVRFKVGDEVLFVSDGYASKVSAKNLIASIKAKAPDAPIEGVSLVASSEVDRTCLDQLYEDLQSGNFSYRDYDETARQIGALGRLLGK